jgi:hypothetical protein
MRDIVTNRIAVSSAVEWPLGGSISKRFDDRHLTIVAFFNQPAAGARLRIVSDALAEATGLPPRLSRLNATAANNNARHGVIELNRYRLNRRKNAFIGGRHG